MPRVPGSPIGSRVPTEQRRSRPRDSLHSEAWVHRRAPFRRVYLLLARGEHGRQLERTNADGVRHPGGAYSRTAWKVNSANFAMTEFSEDKMRRPTPYAVPYGLQVLATGSNAQVQGGSAHG